MSKVLFILGAIFIFVGILPLLRWLKSKISKHHWRVCPIDDITSVVNTRVASRELLPQKSMLVSFRFNNHLHSVLIGYDRRLLLRFRDSQSCTILVDKDNPQSVYNNAQLWHSYATIWLFSGVSLCAGSYFLVP
ncbi:hypothetical protein HJP15_09690 [Pseudoalteromonas sp. NEC-BIFX-2020_002]|uniref:DUF3592 domain-containing protein n=1 Tax=Pseudoalteromonas porphyrae TaxID=187330 RepID=A0A0N1EDY1_9GAMM|nr:MULTISPECIES: hypothetical protein [Pseudoalteromonas]KPH58002.1 hypothetical protein ADS77_18270 [Pseudoalteromonas porphyrae]NNG43185.1 hypothetical protein [Pseudoalteromonas sp. NEC-BIFX-2020_002]